MSDIRDLLCLMYCWLLNFTLLCSMRTSDYLVCCKKCFSSFSDANFCDR